MQRRATGHAEPDGVPPIVHEVLRSSGQPLDSATRESMEARFGHDFGRVRIHADARASESARAVSAQAYTVGTDIVFGAGEYAPWSGAGQRLLAHELAHVVQQRAYGHATHPVTRVSKADDAAEAQAEDAATGVTSMQGTDAVAPMSAPVVQRKADPAAPPLTRAEEVRLSHTSPGEIEAGMNPPTFSLYNFAIDRPTLKPKHVEVLRALASLTKGFTGRTVLITANGHADSSGEDERNDPLSGNRARAVQAALQDAAGVPVQIRSFGERKPVASNDTIAGRSRNRRVDIVFALAGGGIDWPCEGPLLLVCACALMLPVCLRCLADPLVCLCGAFPSLCVDDPTKKKRRACPVSVELPKSKVIDTTWPLVVYPFDMTVVFKQESPDTSPYCDCNCGEYRQYVSGVFERNYGQGPVKPRRHPLAWGRWLDPVLMQEDGPDPYGHRYDRNLARARTGMNVRRLSKAAARPFLKPNRDKDTDPQGVHDKYVPDREDGCRYEGKDSPGLAYSAMDEEIHVRLTFRAGAIDACNGDVEVGEWKTWEVTADRVPPPPGGGGGGGAVFVPPRPSGKAPAGSHSWSYLGGLPKDPYTGQNVKLRIGFQSQGESFWTTIDVDVVVVSDTEVTVMTQNFDPLNVAPDGHPEILVRPYSTVTIRR